MQQFLLQSPLRRMLAAVLMICLIVVSACKDDKDEELAPVTVTFPANGSITVGEAAGEKTINLALSGAAVKDGTISISATDATGVLEVNSSISVTKGNTVAILRFTPTNNTTIGGNKDVTLNISAVTDGFIIGTPATYKVTVVDDEGPTTVFFENNEATVSEASANALELTVSLSAKATAAGSFTITLDPADAPVTTTPAAVNGVITVPVAVGDESVKFTVMPTNDDQDKGDLIVKFKLGETETVKVTEDNELTLAITDDDAIVPVTIASVRALYTGADVALPAKTYIKGVVTSVSANDGNVVASGLYVQDASGAIPIFFASAHGIARSTEIMVNLSGVTLTNFGGYLLEATGTPNDRLTILGEGDLPTVKTITVAQLNSGAFESQLVKLENVSFPDADGLITMEGIRIVYDGTTNGNVFTRNGTNGASFRTEILPVGKGTLMGIASDFTSGPQLLPQIFASDVFAPNPDGTIELSAANALDFGSINKGNKSTPQSYTVTGTTLTAPITVTASTGFQVSKTNTDGDFASSVELSEAGGTIYARFAPNSGADGLNEGTITHKSKGSVSVVLQVKGTEAGNSSTVVLSEAFDYPTDALLTANGWTVSSGGGTNALKAGNANGLNYSGYPLTGGNAIAMTTSGEDDFKTFTTLQPTDETVYASFLVKFSAAQAASDYFFAFSAPGAQTNYYSRLFAKSSGAGYSLGIKKNNETTATTFGSTVLDFGTTYLVVVKYTFNPNDKDDTISVFINPTTNAEPATAEIDKYIDVPASGLDADKKADIANINTVTLRQGSATNAPTLVIDGIRVATVYTDLFN